jgi:hypothetical protein
VREVAMDEKKERAVSKGHTPFFKFLKKKHEVTLYTSYKGDEETYRGKDDGVLKQLRTYMQASNEEGYNELVKKFPNRMFRRTKGEVYEMFDEDETINIDVALQVKGHSLTWYFWAPPGAMDQYPQEFRDKLYLAAAKAHKIGVEEGCDLYYRGSNSVHVKMMHHLESESHRNHNHYRLKDNKPYTPHDFNQHMDALKQTEAFEEFFEPGEIEEIKQAFAEFYVKWHEKQGGGLSKHEEYMRESSQRLNEGDVIELMLFGHQQEPCRISVRELKVDYDAARKAIEQAIQQEDESRQRLVGELAEIDRQYENLLKYREKGGSRGLFSEIASTRQTYQSALQPIPYVGGQDSSFGAPPEVPEWAKTLRKSVEEAQRVMIKTRAEPEVIERSREKEAMEQFNQEIPEHVRRKNMGKITFFGEEKKEETPTENAESKDNLKNQ